MAKKSIFQYRDYKEYLEDLISSRPQGGRGIKSKLATHLGCQTAYVSQVFNGHNDFSLEQADALNSFFGHTPIESEFFLTLVQYNRAGTKSLKSYFKAKISELVQKHMVIKSDLEDKVYLGDEEMHSFFQHWYYAAIQLLLMVPGFNTEEAIIEKIHLKRETVQDVLKFLVRSGLVTKEGVEYKPGKVRMHFTADSPFALKHHQNWRLQAIRSLDYILPSDYHYTSVITIGEDDVEQFRVEIIKFIESFKKKVRTSDSDLMYSFGLDYFQVC